MPKKYTHNEYIEKMKKERPDLEILGVYINSRTNIKVKCKSCGHIWFPKPNGIKGCPNCYIINSGKHLRKTQEEFENEVKKYHPEIEIIGEYINNITPIKCKCKIDGCIYNGKPKTLIGEKGSGCPVCWNKNNHSIQKKSHETFINELKLINSNIDVLSDYTNSYTKIKCKCKVCDNIWNATPDKLLRNRGCPKCARSKGEMVISEVLIKYNIKYKTEFKFKDCKFYNCLPFDFYLSDYNICIEYNGMQHYEIIEYFGGFDRFVNQKIRDTVKSEYCKSHNIILLTIPYWEFDNIEKIIINKLNLKLNQE